MKQSKLNINGHVITTLVADTDTLRAKGLGNINKIGKNKGLIMLFPKTERVSIVMTNMKFPIDLIIIDKNWKVVELKQNLQLGKSYNTRRKSNIILEMNAGSVEEFGIKVGNEVVTDDGLKINTKGVMKFKHGGNFQMIGDTIIEVHVTDVKIDPTKAQLLDEDGIVSANISDKTRIFSRADTKDLIRYATDNELEELAKKFIKSIKEQESKEQENVQK